MDAMKITKGSWHYRAYQWQDISYNDTPSVCGYWLGVFLGTPFMAVLLVVFYPCLWVGEKLKYLWTRFTTCPLGKIEFEDKGD